MNPSLHLATGELANLHLGPRSWYEYARQAIEQDLSPPATGTTPR